MTPVLSTNHAECRYCLMLKCKKKTSDSRKYRRQGVVRKRHNGQRRGERGKYEEKEEKEGGDSEPGEREEGKRG